MYRILELFSGIGSQAKALKNIGCEIVNVGTCDWDIHAMVAYDAIHNSSVVPFSILKLSKEVIFDELSRKTLSSTGKTPLGNEMLKTYSVDSLRRIYTAIKRCNNFVDIESLKGKDVPEDVDIMTYSFPCQDLSNVGAFHGYNKGIDKDSGSRSSLLWQVGRILGGMKRANISMPRFLLMENVPTLLSDRHKENFEKWIRVLSNLGYISKYFQLNSSDFGLPQNRPRLLMISIYAGKDTELRKRIKDYLVLTDENKIIKDYRDSQYFKQIKVSDLLRIDYSDKKLFNEAVECTPNDTESRRKIWEENPQLVLSGNIINEAVPIVRTITTKQDRNPNSGNLFFESGIEGRSNFRYLTPRECFLFMGFTDEDYEQVIKYNPDIKKGTKLISRDKMIKMAGNSIPVKMLEGVFWQIVMMDKEVFGK